MSGRHTGVTPLNRPAHPGLVEAFYEPNANARTAVSYYGPGYDGPGGSLERRAMSALKNNRAFNIPGHENRAAVDDADDAVDTSFHYTPLPHELMVKINEFYHSQALIVDAAEKILNFYTIGDENEIQATFGGRPLPERQNRQVNIALSPLLPSLRAWRHMFGFIAVRDPGRALDEARDDLDAAAARQGQTEDGIEDGAERPAREDPADEAVRESIDRMGEIFGSAGAQMRKDIMNRIIEREDDIDGNEAVVDAFALLDRTRAFARMRGDTRRTTATSTSPTEFESDDEVGTSTAEATEAPRSTPAARARRTLSEAIASMQRFTVMTLSDGRFFIEHDRLTDERRVVFASNRDNEKLYADYDRYGEAPSWARDDDNTLVDVVVDRGVMVYVWPDMMPLHDGQLASKMGEVLRLRDVYAQAEAYVMRSNAARANPLQLYVTQPEKPINASYSQLTDQQLHIGGSAEQTSRELREALFAEGSRAARADARLQMQNGRLNDEITRRLASMPDTTATTGITGIRVPDAPPEHKYLLLPEGVVPSNSVVQPSTDINVGELRYNYEQALASVIGIPLTMLRAGGAYSRISGSAGGGASTGSAALTVRALGIAVRNDRDVLAQGVAGLYDLAFRSIDNETIRTALGSLDVVSNERRSRLQAEIDETRSNIEKLTDITEKEIALRRLEQRKEAVQSLARRVDVLTNNLLSIAARTFRFEVHFLRLLHVPMSDIQLAKEENALSAFEYVNLLRARINLRPFDRIEQWQKTIEKQAAPNSDPFMSVDTQKRVHDGDDGGSGTSSTARKRRRASDADGDGIPGHGKGPSIATGASADL